MSQTTKILTFTKVLNSMALFTALIAFFCFARRSLLFFRTIPGDYYGHNLWMYLFDLC
ncbi:MAG: hypothetical protein LBJ95_03255 [Oscillospiraceae bacterium]|nr:hypothetical protein [Oscillospiraceae bacterium]